MGRLKWEDDNVKSSGKLPVFNEENGTVARLALLDEIETRYVHTFVKPIVRRGKLVMKKKDFGEGETHDTDYVGRAICLGDEEILDVDGRDPKHCPACARQKEAPKRFRRPDQRLATNAFQYNVDQDGVPNTEPVTGKVVVLAFNHRHFEDIMKGLRRGFRGDPISKHDILIEVVNKGFKNWKISVVKDAAWTENEAGVKKQLASSSFSPDQIVDACGPSRSRTAIEDWIEEIDAEWAKVEGEEDDSTSGQERRAARKADLGTGLDALGLDDEDEAPAPKKATVKVVEDDEDEAPRPARTSGRRSKLADPDEDEAPVAKPAAKADAGESLNLDDLLAEMDQAQAS